MQIHAIAALVVLTLAHAVKLPSIEIAILFLVIALVITTEMINTAIETVVDRIGTDYHPLAAIAKNVAAGAVLVSTVIAVSIGWLIFKEKILELIAYIL